MKTNAPIQVIVHYPKTQEGKRELARRVSAIHADFVISSINKLNCPTKQKLELLQAVIDTTMGRYQAPNTSASEQEQEPRKKRQ